MLISKIVVYTIHNAAAYGRRAPQCGAKGFPWGKLAKISDF
jgi:hypothetical protein